MDYVTNSPAETEALAEKLAARVVPGTVLALSGDLGTGKTVFTRGFARGLGITDTVNSPTFAIVNEYESHRGPFYHFDVYRIEDADELYEIGFDEYIDEPGAFILIEWPERIMNLLPKETVFIRLEKDFEQGPDYRRICIGGKDETFGH
ncbi:MAG: tRNA (adenosine(37)-N6)-threonylcarbamoyltransferase complex ATPase subunit type 1 TsaE [Eubacteriales bacterium]|nr:tRNA (adenosine(37)-N6)-threonylcarbamoyltransferase complex ATPase subunit type 1 TsaE [Eubacteriales bacterium]